MRKRILTHRDSIKENKKEKIMIITTKNSTIIVIVELAIKELG